MLYLLCGKWQRYKSMIRKVLFGFCLGLGVHNNASCGLTFAFAFVFPSRFYFESHLTENVLHKFVCHSMSSMALIVWLTRLRSLQPTDSITWQTVVAMMCILFECEEFDFIRNPLPEPHHTLTDGWVRALFLICLHFVCFFPLLFRFSLICFKGKHMHNCTYTK